MITFTQVLAQGVFTFESKEAPALRRSISNCGIGKLRSTKHHDSDTTKK